MLAVYFALPESLPPTAAAAARQRREQDSMNATLLHGRTPSSAAGLLDAAWKALAVLRRTPLFVQLTIILMMSAIVSEGLQDILIQYLQIKLGFQRRDVGHLFMALGVGALTVQTVFLRPLLGLLGEARLLCLGVVASVLQQAALAAASAKWHALTAVCLGSFGES
jgi:Na+/melibiose symporter-like transporter